MSRRRVSKAKVNEEEDKPSVIYRANREENIERLKKDDQAEIRRERTRAPEDR